MRYSITRRDPALTPFFGRAFENLFDDEMLWPAWPAIDASKGFNPKAEVHETEEAYLLSLDVPGMKDNEIKLEVKDDRLMISGERKSNLERKEGGRVITEKTYGSFERFFTLPDNADLGKIEAHVENGVLQVAVPKTAASKAKTIEVKKGSSSFFEKLVGPKNQ